MYKFRAKHLFICAFASAIPVLAGTSAIGVAVSQGNIVVNNLKAPGSATIFDGNVLQTSDSPSQVRLTDGAQIRFGTDSRGKLFSDHVDLEKGSASVSGNTGKGYEAKANGLTVRPETNGSATVTMQGGAIEVAAIGGNVHVFNAQGVNVANLIPGKSLSLRPQGASAGTASSVVGCVVKQGNDLILTDETSNVTVRLSGEAVHTGKRVQLTGTDASGVIKVANVKELEGPCQPASSASMHTAASTAGVAAGNSASGATASTVAVAAGVGTGGATVATAGAATATGGFSIATTTAVIAGVATANAGTVSTVASSSGTSGGNGGTSGHPNCISPCTF